MGIIKKNIPLEEVLFSKTLREVLALLFTHLNQSFHTNEIIRLVSSGSGAVQRELKKLAATELIMLQKIGNQKHYHVNQNSVFSNSKMSLKPGRFKAGNQPMLFLKNSFIK